MPTTRALRLLDGSSALADDEPRLDDPDATSDSAIDDRLVERVRVGHRCARLDDGAEIEAAAPNLAMLFDEAGLALAELVSGADVGAPASMWERQSIDARDVAGLADAWLDRLASLAARHRCLLVDVAVDRVEAPADGAAGPWRLIARVGLRSTGRPDRPTERRLVLATSPGLAIRRLGDGYWLRARLRSVDVADVSQLPPLPLPRR